MGGKNWSGNAWDTAGNPNAIFAGGSSTGNGSVFQKLIDPGGFIWDQSGGLPTPPDFQGDALKQGNSTIPNQSNPFATSQWTVDPVTGQRTQQVSLNGDLGSAAKHLMGDINSGASKPLPTGQEARDQAISSAYAQAMSRLKPEWDQRQKATTSQLATQGLDPTSEAAQTTQQNFDRSRNDAETSAMASAIGQGTQAGATIFGEGLQSRAVPYAELNQLQGLTSGFATGTQATPYATADAAKYAADADIYSAKQAGKNSKTAGAMQGVGTVAAMF